MFIYRTHKFHFANILRGIVLKEYYKVRLQCHEFLRVFQRLFHYQMFPYESMLINTIVINCPLRQQKGTAKKKKKKHNKPLKKENKSEILKYFV